MLKTLLGGLSPRRFLEEYWQKKPLLVRGAIPGYRGLLDRDELIALACRDDVESRLVDCGDWSVKHGPLTKRDFRRRGLPKGAPWTVLVQGVNLLLDEGDRLLRKFDFIPYARLDDLMASYATDGAGVGPHFDNYDVFLLQGSGRRHWRIGAQRDRRFVDGLPLKILRDFRPSQEFTLEPGDMLYLPPQYAHDGVAIGECTTWSIGFRAPPYVELGDAFLTYMQDQLDLPDRYADPDLNLQRHAAEISATMIDRVAHELSAIRWDRRHVGDFLGRYLTEPKHNVFFDPPPTPLTLPRFKALAQKHGVRLDRRSQLLFSGRRFYLNGETVAVPAAVAASARKLADARWLSGNDIPDESIELFHEWYGDGFLAIDMA